jgi:drug/metabolite transporter superfamily protein YnfA
MNSKLLLLREFWLFLKEQKKFWLLPMIIVLLLFGMLLVFAQSSALAPFIYTLF